MKRLWVVALVVAASACVLAQSEPRPVPQQKPQEDQDRVTDEALRAIAGELRAIRNEATQRESDQEASELKVWGDTIPNWGSFVVTFLGVLAALGTLTLLYSQTKATKRAADAATKAANTSERQLKLVHQQWLTITPEIDALPTDKGEPAPVAIRPMFTIHNGTPMALTLTKVEARIDGLTPGKMITSTETHVLPRDQGYPGFAGILQLEGVGNWADYAHGKLKIDIVGNVHFIDAFEDSRVQPFGFAYRGGKGGWTFTDYSGSMAHHSLPPTKADTYQAKENQRSGDRGTCPPGR